MGEGRRIVLVSPMYPYRGGIAHLSETLAAGLIARGHRVHAITFTRQYPEFLFPGRTQYETETDIERAVEAERVIDSINPLSWWKAVKRIRELGAEVVIFRYWMPFLLRFLVQWHASLLVAISHLWLWLIMRYRMSAGWAISL